MQKGEQYNNYAVMDKIRGWIRQNSYKNPETKMNELKQKIENRAAKLREELKDAIAERAYQKWLERNCEHGYDETDWLLAENEVIVEHTVSEEVVEDEHPMSVYCTKK